LTAAARGVIRATSGPLCPQRPTLLIPSISFLNPFTFQLVYSHLGTKSISSLDFTDICPPLVNPKEVLGTLAQGAILVVAGLGSTAETSTGAASLAGILSFRTVPNVLTISRLKRWSIRY
jgi:hypothetical protein